MPAYLPFDPNPRVPAVTLPPLACDSQFHVFGPPEKYPVRPGAAYEMPTATVERALKMHRTLGLQRGIIVQPTTYGADHQATLDGIAAAGPNYRGCANAAVFDSADDATLAKLHAGGIRGARFSRQSLGIALTPEAFARAIAPHPGAWLVHQGAARDERLCRTGGAIRKARPAGHDRSHGAAEPGSGPDDPSLRKTSNCSSAVISG